MPDEIEVPVEVDAATYAYLLKQAAPRHKGEGSRRKPELPAHPNCSCSLVVARLVGQDEEGAA